MPNAAFEEGGETPTIEVRVYRRGTLIHRELCESEEQASLVVDAWAESEGVTCEVDDLSTEHRPDQILGPEVPDILDGDYPDQIERRAEKAQWRASDD